MWLPKLSALFLGCMVSAGASAAFQVQFTATPLPNVGTGDVYRYNYSLVSDDVADPAVRNVIFLFDPALYGDVGDLQIVGESPNAPDGWVADVFLVPDQVLDVLEIGTVPGAELAGGETLGGFSVAFRWFGEGVPGSQPYIYCSDECSDETFLGDGSTVSAAVPEPGTLALFASAALLAFARRRRQPH